LTNAVNVNRSLAVTAAVDGWSRHSLRHGSGKSTRRD